MSDLQSRLNSLSPEQRALLSRRLIEQRKRHRGGAGRIVPKPDEWAAPFPLRDLQQAYWVGRRGDMHDGGISTHAYTEVEGDFDLMRLQAAWDAVLARHAMLRCRISAEGEQRILPVDSSASTSIPLLDLSGLNGPDLEAALQRRRKRLATRVLDDSGELYELNATLLPDGRYRLHIHFDGLIVDGWSMCLVLHDWARAYGGDSLPLLELGFRDLVLAEQEVRTSSRFDRDKDYWQSRIAELPTPPSLPVSRGGAQSAYSFRRQEWRPSHAEWQGLRAQMASTGLSLTGVLCQAFADVLSCWSGMARFSLNIPRFNRPEGHPSVPELAGEFASLSILAVENGSGSFLERARRNQKQLWTDLDHSSFTGIDVLRELSQRSEAQAQGPAMPVVFTAAPKNAHGQEMTIEAGARALGNVVFRMNYSSQVWLDLHVGEDANGLHVEWDSVDEVLAPAISDDMFDAFRRRVRALAGDQDSWSWDLQSTLSWLLPASQRTQRETLRNNGTIVPWPSAVHPIVQRMARDPSAIAVIAGTESLTYGALSNLSSYWAKRLRQAGVGTDVPVPVLMERGLEQIIAVLSILRAGGAYVPVDPNQPPARVSAVLADIGSDIVLTQSRLKGRVPHDYTPWILEDPPMDGVPEDGGLDQARGEDLAYVLYTSGSTGTPKGVMVQHVGVANALSETIRLHSIGPADRVLALTSLHHDLSVFDLLGTLAAGGRIVMIHEEEARDPFAWASLIQTHGVTIWNSVPAMMHMLMEALATSKSHAAPRLSTLRLAFLGGDWIPVDLPARIREASPDVTVVSTGGPTETTLWNILHPVAPADAELPSIPYGKPIANTAYYILSDLGHECPNGVIGELCAAGPGLARGYWNDEEKTAGRFRPHPKTGERLCYTGDLGRFRPDCTIEFLGRKDLQVKIQGHRIELGEIESALAAHPSVEAAVVVVATSKGDSPYLTGYVVPASGTSSRGDFSVELQDHVGRLLPNHMIPARITAVSEFPLTRNGKVDRKALSLKNGAEAPTKAPVATALLNRVTAIISSVLELSELDPSRALTSYGANSIDMVRLGNALEEDFGHRPRMAELFRLQSAQRLAAYYTREDPQHPVAREGSSEGTGLELANEPARRLLSRFTVISDPAERQAFKESRPGIRTDLDPLPRVPLAGSPITEDLRSLYRSRRSYREFDPSPISATSFGKFMACLRAIDLGDTTKWLYASPGGLYPNQIYLHIKRGRVAEIGAGTYYYHPTRHELIRLTAAEELGDGLHVPYLNEPIHERAAFSVFIVTDLAAIAPSYGELSVRFATMEAGALAHHLETCSVAQGLGLCQIGSLEEAALRPLLQLKESHILMHSLLGGKIRTEDSGGDAQKAKNLLEKVRGLSEVEARRLLRVQENALEVQRSGEVSSHSGADCTPPQIPVPPPHSGGGGHGPKVE